MLKTILSATVGEQAVKIVHGHVKWFDPAKGFGFIVGAGEPEDILLRVNVLRDFGQGLVAEGAAVSVKVQQTQTGYQAIEVLNIEPSPEFILPLGEDDTGTTLAGLLELPLEPARVKWFDKSKGFGFAQIFSRPGDVFIHSKVLHISGFADLQAGEAVCLRIVEGKRGRMAVQVTLWEASLRESDWWLSWPMLRSRPAGLSWESRAG